MSQQKRKSTVAPGLLAKPGGAPARGVPVENLPPAPAPVADAPRPALAEEGVRNIKTQTTGTTLYLLPDESWRLKALANRLRTSVHDLILDSLDRTLAMHGEPPLQRYARSKSRKA